MWLLEYIDDLITLSEFCFWNDNPDTHLRR